MTDQHPNDPALTRPERSPMPGTPDPRGQTPPHERNTKSPAQGEIGLLRGLTPSDGPAWAGRAVIGVSVAAGLVLVGEPLGLGVVVVLLALGVVAGRVPRRRTVPGVDLRKREQPPHDRWTRVWWAFAAALALVPLIRTAGWVVVPSLLAAAALASLAASGGRRWGELIAGATWLWALLPFGPVSAGRSAARGVRLTHAGPALRGAALAAVLLAVFVPLLASADAAFAQILEDVVPTAWASDDPLARVLVAALFCALGGALVLVRVQPARVAPIPPKRGLGRLEWGLPLGALVALFAAFVALQLTTLFGGDTHVLQTAGLTYAEYARSGFWQLLTVAALTFAVVGAAQRWARDGGRVLPVLLGALCILTLVLLASALKRLGLLEDTYGFTRLRFAAHAALLWLGALFALVLVARFRAAWLPRAIVAATATAFLAFALADPERWIADRNVDRAQRTGTIDYEYLSRLGADAAPALARLKSPEAACVRERLRRRIAEPAGPAGFNLARERARSALRPAPCDFAAWTPRTRTVR